MARVGNRTERTPSSKRTTERAARGRATADSPSHAPKGAPKRPPSKSPPRGGAYVPDPSPAPMTERFEAFFDRSPNIRLVASMKTAAPIASPAFDRSIRAAGGLAELIENPPTLRGQATEHMDGRHVPLVLAMVRTKQGATRGGIPIRLIHDGRLRDTMRTTNEGFVLLKFARREAKKALSGKIQLADADGKVVEKNVALTGEQGFAVLDIVLDELPVPPSGGGLPDVGGTIEGLPDLGDSAPSDGGGSGPSTNGGVLPPMPNETGDDLFDRLPSDFGAEVCEELSGLLANRRDPLLVNPANPMDFRTRRTRLIKRITVPRVGPMPDGGGPPNRYLVTLRQEWFFLGYTLGELAEVEPLDPGQIIEQTTQSVQRTTNQLSEETQRHVRDVLTTVQNTLTKLSSVDTFLNVATSVNTSVEAAGFGNVGPRVRVGGGLVGGILGGAAGGLIAGPIGAVAGAIGGFLLGGGDASASVGLGGELGTRTTTNVVTNATTRSNVDTSLYVNSLMRTAQSSVNTAVRTAAQTLRQVESTLTRSIGQVSPLLSRVTNLLRWQVYENYAVCTHAEDVVEIRAERIADLPPADVPLFSDEDIADYRRAFSPALLEPRLRPHFDLLAAAVAQKRAASMPVAKVHVTADYTSPYARADLRVTIRGQETVIPLRPGGSRGYDSVRLTTPVAPADLGDAEFELVFRELDAPRFAGLFGGLLGDAFEGLYESVGRATVTKVRLGFESVPGVVREQVHTFGTDLSVTGSEATDNASLAMTPPEPAVFTEFDPLFRHINRNRTYYLGLLLEAALAEPGLRDDAPQLAAFHGDSPLWRLPIIGFEGDRVLVIGDAAESDDFASGLLADPGAGTLVQLAAPGAYGEALEGLLGLTDALGKIHPALLPLPVPQMPPLALVDMTGKQLQVVGSTTGTGTPGTMPGVPVPLPP